MSKACGLYFFPLFTKYMISTTLKKSEASNNNYEQDLKKWIIDEKAAIELIHVVGHLRFDCSVELVLFRNQLYNKSASEIMNFHQYAKDIVKQPIDIQDTLILAKNIVKLEIAPSRLDIGKLTSEWLQEKEKYNNSVTDFLKKKLENYIGHDKKKLVPKDVVLYGFGRIGRLLARELISQAGKGEQLRLKAIVTRSNSDIDIVKRADLLRNDSVHGPFPGTVLADIEKKCLIVNGHSILMLSASDPAELNYEEYNIQNALLIDNTGVSRDREGLSKHLKAKGIEKVLLTAPGKGDIPNIVHGVNHKNFNRQEKIFSAASCTCFSNYHVYGC